MNADEYSRYFGLAKKDQRMRISIWKTAKGLFWHIFNDGRYFAVAYMIGAWLTFAHALEVYSALALRAVAFPALISAIFWPVYWFFYSSWMVWG
ncbi:hypothetical protein KEU06_09770 [Pseudaminobacter sp. 19-2017]|uniref:Uncharacterized protein n=1 Tax=Pseudaminobacter soli (ex Zhang et al. 2022) TaxID=2831468 RepID=A0A942DWE6_9HYPH|nr:hypothetical protein [Pseudaminobacter soli]MBS3648894.1 hypothetical protein [Pseudaminobacter soli]